MKVTFLFVAYCVVIVGIVYYFTFARDDTPLPSVGDTPLPSVGNTLKIRSTFAYVEVADLDDSFGTECDINDTTIEIERISDGIIIAKVISSERDWGWSCTVGTSVMMSSSDWLELVDDTDRHHEKARAKTERLKRARDMLERAK